MSENIAYNAAMMKKAEHVKQHVLGTILDKSKLENWEFDDEDIQTAWELLDYLTMINQVVSVGASVIRVTERIELAESVMKQRDTMEQLGLPFDDQTYLRSLEEIR